ncbi:coiled-coil domain-containing protein 178 [Carettochelys insculpta]|uniref:coiled-coil domain-containing protein 178 n=1 Tax=Carettochelys insculpta TaxID=44489 RepID=UPI003EC06115
MEAATNIWKTPASIPPTNKQADKKYFVPSRGMEFLFNHPQPNSLLVEASQHRSKTPQYKCTGSDKDTKKLDLFGRTVYYSSTLLLLMASYATHLSNHNFDNYMRLTSLMNFLPDDKKPVLKAIVQEGNAASRTGVQIALDVADTAARCTATTVVMRRELWLQTSGIPKDLQSKIEDLPFDREKLFADSTDSVLHSSKDSRTTLRMLGSRTLNLKDEREAVLSEVTELIKRLEAEWKEAEEALVREKQLKKKLVMKIDCMSVWRLQHLPIAVQKEHDICAQDISELQWHFDCANRQLQQVKAQILKIETANKKIQEDIDFMKKYSPLLEEKLNLEGDAMKDVLLAHEKASELYYDVYSGLLKIQQILKQVTEEAEKERRSMSDQIKYAGIVLNQYQNDLKHSEFLWTELCMKIKETEEKIIEEERHLEELVKQKEEVQKDAKSWNNKVQELNNKILAQENENASIFNACSEVIKKIDDLKFRWESEQLNMKQTILHTLQAVDELESENKVLEKENEEYMQKSRESSRRKITYESELQIICKNTRKIEERIRKANKEMYNIELAYGEGKTKLEELEEKIIEEKIRYKNLEENIKNLIRNERRTWQLTQARIKTMYGELEQKKKDSVKTKEETIKLIADIEGPVAELEAKYIGNKNIHKENIEKLCNLNQRLRELDEQKKQVEQQLEYRKSTMKNQLTDIQEKYSDVSKRLDETTHIIENFQNRINELNELTETKQRQMETTEKSLIELRKNFGAVNFKQEKNQMILDYLQNELEKYEKRIQCEEKTYGELLWIRQKHLEDMEITLEQMLEENWLLAQEYQIFQKYYLNEKENLMDIYDDRVKMEAAVTDHQQGEMSKTIQHITAFLHSLTDGSSTEDDNANNQCVLGAEVKDKKSHTVQITV